MSPRSFLARPIFSFALGLTLLAGLVLPIASADASEWVADAPHSSAYFRARHSSLSLVYGMFRQSSGKISYDEAAPEKTTLDLTVKTDSIDTNSPDRDKHLKGPDFFSAKEFPNITFKSTAVKASGKNLEVTGDFTMHGVTKSVTLTFETATGEFPKGTQRVSFTTEVDVKRSDFGMKTMIGPVSDEIHIFLSFEAVPAK
jgi:polyisoprenoid-binding protein YceI